MVMQQFLDDRSMKLQVCKHYCKQRDHARELDDTHGHMVFSSQCRQGQNGSPVGSNKCLICCSVECYIIKKVCRRLFYSSTSSSQKLLDHPLAVVQQSLKADALACAPASLDVLVADV